jgi:PAS domain S-box-containing protein
MTSDVSASARKELIRHSVDVLTVLDERGDIKYESPAFSRMFGYDPNEFVGENVFDHVHPDDRQRVRDTFRDLVDADAESTTRSVELRFRHADEGWLWIESRGASEEGSAVDGYVVTSRDIGERKAYERDLERERDRLERFASIVSHDLRSPLTVANGQLELARDECASDHLDAVQRAHDRMSTLIGDLLALAREGAATPQLETIDLAALARDSWRHTAMGDATLVVETTTSIVADEGQLRRLLENLFRNSAEHGSTGNRTESGDAVEHGSTSPRSQAPEDSVEHGSTGSRSETDDSAEHGAPGVTVVVGALDDGFYVADDGTGLPAHDPETLLDFGVSTAAGGSGLGLSIVNEVVENHGWNLTLTDGDDGGARFEIRGVEAPTADRHDG